MANEKRLIDANEVRDKAIPLEGLDGDGIPYEIVAVPVDAIDYAPTADAVEVETIKAWLYEIAMNNVGYPLKDFATACEEIISRVDGLRTFAKERRTV